MLIFIVEMMGATTTLLWGLNILLDPVNEPLRQDPDNPGLTIVSFCVLGGGGGGGLPPAGHCSDIDSEAPQSRHAVTHCPSLCAYQCRHSTWYFQRSHDLIRLCWLP